MDIFTHCVYSELWTIKYIIQITYTLIQWFTGTIQGIWTACTITHAHLLITHTHHTPVRTAVNLIHNILWHQYLAFHGNYDKYGIIYSKYKYGIIFSRINHCHCEIKENVLRIWIVRFKISIISKSHIS